MTTQTKILFIGIDGADKNLILGWAHAGLLPTIQTLLQRSLWGSTVNPPGLYVGAVWPSFYTGTSPAQHTRYCFEQLLPGTYEEYQFRPTDVKGEQFWETLSHVGKKVAVIDVPKSSPSPDLNGIQIVDWGTHDPDIKSGLYTWPLSLAAEVNVRFGEDSIGDCNGQRSTPADFIGLRDELIKRVAKKKEISSHFLAQGGWDCFVTVFSESHCIGHQCWHIHDERHPRHDPAVAQAVGDPIKDVYIAIDTAIGQLLEQAGPETAVIILASHGMGPHYDATFLLDEILQRLEAPKAPKSYPRLTEAIGWVWGMLPLALRQRLKPLSMRTKTYVDPRTRRLSTRKCFQIPNNDAYGGVRINLRGREPGGQISPGSEYDSFCASLTHDLLDIVNLDTGQPVVKKVLRTGEFYQGENIDHLPDLLIEWNRETPVASIHSFKTGNIKGEYRGCRTGDHTAEGLFFITAPSVRPGPVDHLVSVTDFAPTMAYLLGVELPQAEGKSIL